MDPQSDHGEVPPHWWEIWFIHRTHTNTWLRPGFRHCFALGYQPALDVWTLVDHRGSKLDVYAVSHEVAEAVRDFARELDGRALVVREITRNEALLHFGWLSCVETIKRILGIRAPWVWTPRQLFDHLSSFEDAYLLEEPEHGEHHQWLVWRWRRWLERGRGRGAPSAAASRTAGGGAREARAGAGRASE